MRSKNKSEYYSFPILHSVNKVAMIGNLGDDKYIDRQGIISFKQHVFNVSCVNSSIFLIKIRKFKLLKVVRFLKNKGE